MNIKSLICLSMLTVGIGCAAPMWAQEADSSDRFPFGSKEYYFARLVKPYNSAWAPAVLIREFPEMAMDGAPHYYRDGGETQRELMVGEVIVSTDPDIKPGTVLVREGFGAPGNTDKDRSRFHVISTSKKAHHVFPLTKDGRVIYISSDGFEYLLSGERLKMFPDDLLQGPWMEMKKAVLQGAK